MPGVRPVQWIATLHRTARASTNVDGHSPMIQPPR